MLNVSEPLYILLEVGCLECGEETIVRGVYVDENGARRAVKEIRETEKFGGGRDLQLHQYPPMWMPNQQFGRSIVNEEEPDA